MSSNNQTSTSAIPDPWEFKSLFKIFAIPPEPPLNAKCEYRRKIIGYYYLALALVSLIYTCLIAHLCRRFDNMKQNLHSNPKCLKRFRYFFGLPVPISHTIYRYHSTSYIGAYLCAFNLIAGIFSSTFSPKYDFPEAPYWVGIIFKILAICYMAFTILPMFLSITYGGKFAWAFGVTYCFIQMIFLIIIILMGFCGTIKDGVHYMTLQLPSLIGYAILSGHFISCLDKHTPRGHTTFLEPCPPNPAAYVTSVVQYVKERLQRPQASVNQSEPKKKCCQRIWKFYHETFHPPNGFSYPPALTWSLSISILLHYMMFNRTLSTLGTYVTSGKTFITQIYPDLAKTLRNNLDLSNARHVYQSFSGLNLTKDERFKLEYAFIYYMIDLFWVGIIVSSVIACLVNMSNITKILHTYQKWSFQLYQKGFKQFPQFQALLSPFEVTNGTTLFPSYQIAMMGCSFHLQVLLYVFIFMFLSFTVGLNAFTPHRLIVNFFLACWPSSVLLFFFFSFQSILMRFVYTPNRGKTYGFKNVRSLQQFMFFASFYNIFFGIINGAVRILLCPISSAVTVARMDLSVFSHALQSIDKAHVVFLGFIYGDVMQHNPMLRTFVWFLSSERIRKQNQLIHSCDLVFLSECVCFYEQTKSNQDNQIEFADFMFKLKDMNKSDSMLSNLVISPCPKSKNKARNAWFLAYTLLRNPQLKRYRKCVRHMPVEAEDGSV